MFDWWDFLTVATRLVAEGDEASLRSALSRAYYASFGSARVWLQFHRPDVHVPTDGRAHRAVWDIFQRHPTNRRHRRIGLEGSRLHRRRKSADYDRTVPDLEREVAVALQQALNIRSWL